MNRKMLMIGIICFITFFFITSLTEAQNERPIVRIVYFMPSDTQPQENIDAKLDTLIKNVQKSFADEMERHGFGRKTFLFESNVQGNAMVHHLTLYYESKNAFSEVIGEISRSFNISKDIIFCLPEFSTDVLDAAGKGTIGTGNGGVAMTFNGATGIAGLTAHEIGHVLGLRHDAIHFFSFINLYSGTIIMPYCTAEWLNVHRAFNLDVTVDNEPSTIEMIQPSFESKTDTIRIDFNVSDSDGLHQAQLIAHNRYSQTETRDWQIDCKRLSNKTISFEFNTSLITTITESVELSLIDSNGNISRKYFPFNFAQLFPQSKIVSIPDTNLESIVRQELVQQGVGIDSSQPITTHKMLDLRYLQGEFRGIRDLTGLEYALNLVLLNLFGNDVKDIAPIKDLKYLADVRLLRNPLSNESIRVHIPAMQKRGVDISYSPRTHPEILLVSSDGQEDLIGRVLPDPIVVEYRDANDNPIQGEDISFSIRNDEGELTDTTVRTDADGKAQTFLHLGWKVGTVTVRATAEGVISPPTFTAKAILPENHVTEDVNVDGVVDVMDLVLVAATIGTTPPEDTYPNPDVNADGVINSDDLALVMTALENTPTAPAAVMTAENLQRWIDEAKQMTNKDATFLRGIGVLEELLASLLPEKTALLANYPNPFNPETWIPYHLAKPAEVTLHIYGVDGALVRTLTLEHRQAGIYEHQSRAVYWDGRNAQGERVASGIYLYTLTAGEYTSTRKMLIRK